jgi:hypothetical protein
MFAQDDAQSFYKELAFSPRVSAASSVSVEEVTHTPAWLSAAQPSQPARVNLAWLTHLAGSSRSTGTAAVDQQPLLRALAAALPELGLYVELPLVARGVPGEAFIGEAPFGRASTM